MGNTHRAMEPASSAWQYTGPSVAFEICFKPGTTIPSASNGAGGFPPTWSKWSA
jgi:hypothetical protein